MEKDKTDSMRFREEERRIFVTQSVREGIFKPVCSDHFMEKPTGTYLRMMQVWRKLILAWRDPNAENCLIINMTFFGFNAELSSGVSALSPHVDEQEVARSMGT